MNRTWPRRLLGALTLLSLLAASLAPRGSQAKIRFVQNSTESQVPKVLNPWTQKDACACCVCWETALGTIFSYWDDYKYQGKGPWEILLFGGNGFDQFRFALTTGDIYKASGVGCKAGSTWSGFFTKAISTKAATAVSNTKYGYSFKYDEDTWVWFNSDIRDEIDADKPLYYGYYPEGTGAHAVTIVGYDDSDKTLFIYKNWAPVVTRKGYDEAKDHEVLTATPAGTSSPPGAWTCGSSSWEARDGCHCNCGGAYDPDCDDPTQAIKNCAATQTCNLKGQCVGSTCKDECPTGDTRCVSGSAYQLCGNHDADSCLEWGSTKSCQAGAKCSGKSCVATCQPKCQMGTKQCVDASNVQSCVLGASQCPVWGASKACPAGTGCFQAQCQAEHCGNKIDDDGDSKVDCDDSDCAGKPHCKSVVIEHCANRVDDDGDGFTDCADPDCLGMQVCRTSAGPGQPGDDGGCALARPGAPPAGPGLLLALSLLLFLWSRRGALDED